MVSNNEQPNLRVSYEIKDYYHDYMLHTYSPPPFTRALGLGPLMFLFLEMMDGHVSDARFNILANFPPDEVIISPLRVSLQIALVFTLYLIPLLFGLVYFDSKIKTICFASGIYLLFFVLNAIYYFLTIRGCLGEAEHMDYT